MQPLIVTAAIIRSQTGILLTRRPEGSRHAGMWEFPGGKLEPGESPEQCLRRELLEELDLPVEVGQVFEVVYHRYDWGAVLILAYECRALSRRIRNLEVAEHRWVPPKELPEYDILAADAPIVRKLTF
ncbi:DNA mismatch repair protein MutT [Desulfuromonas versatilis]|uniref:8-oxo-dGTP diphosphatase n=1 Tax=Desulfuromonas versatilis TaxID=2802975 RepID=A0ABN6DVZ5_9BACT|nr:(deoxy)nucleoside triphosphate pyrophosphohydrolase [Desulfuromonas versatilis]BCR04161.1 DNA mismatch repair protein MutT [Desulfuromonas versatilis]